MGAQTCFASDEQCPDRPEQLNASWTIGHAWGCQSSDFDDNGCKLHSMTLQIRCCKTRSLTTSRTSTKSPKSATFPNPTNPKLTLNPTSPNPSARPPRAKASARPGRAACPRRRDRSPSGTQLRPSPWRPRLAWARAQLRCHGFVYNAQRHFA